MELLILYTIVAIVGYYIMTEPKLGGSACFQMCDIGKGLFGLALTTVLTLIIKGPLVGVNVVEDHRKQ